MSLEEVVDELHSKYPGLVTQGAYSPPTHRCSRWFLLQGPFYGDSDYTCTVLVDATQIYQWSLIHLQSVVSSNQRVQSARKFLPEWIKDADRDDESVTALDPSIRDALKDWDLDLILFGWAKVWCPGCGGFSGVFGKAQHEYQKTQNKLRCIRYLPAWICEKDHVLKVDGDKEITLF